MAIETQEFSITCSQSQTSVTGGTTYTGSTTITFTKGEIQSLSVSNSKATASFSGSIITIRGTSPIKNGRVTGTVTITYQGLEKIKITKSDGTSSLISIAFPTEPGRYKIKAAMDNGTTIESGTFLRYASDSNRTLKVRFGLSDGTSQDVSLTLMPTGANSPIVTARLLQDSMTGYWALDGTVKNTNGYPVKANVSVSNMANGEIVRSGNGIVQPNSQSGFAELLNVDCGSVKDVHINVVFTSRDGYVGVGLDYEKDIINSTVIKPSISYTAEWMWTISEWKIFLSFSNKNAFPLTARIYWSINTGAGYEPYTLQSTQTISANGTKDINIYEQEGALGIQFRIVFADGNTDVATTEFTVVANEETSTVWEGEV